MMGLQIAKAAFNCNPIVVDVDENKLKLALENGASAAINPMHEDAASKVLEITGGNASVAIDFVGSEQSTAFGTNLLRKGGKYIIVGLYGGELKLPLPLIPILERGVQGSYTGSPGDMHELMKLVRSGKVDPIPVEKRPASEANQTLEDLKNGKIIGRAALMHD
jgi:Zn-dependent alcohol dehydrogenases